jgi:hypothetical protein
MIAAAFASFAMCAGAHAVMASPRKQSSVRERSIQDLRTDVRNARFATLACDTAGLQVPIHKTMTLRKEDTL